MKTVIVSLTDDELAGWLGDIYAESGDIRTGATRIYDCGCSAKRDAGEAKWRVRFSSTCDVTRRR
jgi:hypothetical protein